jgi:hypothetical protein
MSPARKIIVFDIETTSRPETEIAHLMPQFAPPANYKDPETIQAWLDKAKAKWLTEAALSPVSGRIEAIGIANLNQQGSIQYNIHLNENGSAAMEADLIKDFWTMTVVRNTVEWVGFNCLDFDLSFLVRRSWALGIIPPSGIRSGRYWADQFVDLLDLWRLGNRQEYISLDRLAKFLGLPGKKEDGSLFHKLEPAQKVAYIENDLKLTMNIAQRLLCQ